MGGRVLDVIWKFKYLPCLLKFAKVATGNTRGKGEECWKGRKKEEMKEGLKGEEERGERREKRCQTADQTERQRERNSKRPTRQAG